MRGDQLGQEVLVPAQQRGWVALHRRAEQLGEGALVGPQLPQRRQAAAVHRGEREEGPVEPSGAGAGDHVDTGGAAGDVQQRAVGSSAARSGWLSVRRLSSRATPPIQTARLTPPLITTAMRRSSRSSSSNRRRRLRGSRRSSACSRRPSPALRALARSHHVAAPRSTRQHGHSAGSTSRTSHRRGPDHAGVRRPARRRRTADRRPAPPGSTRCRGGRRRPTARSDADPRASVGRSADVLPGLRVRDDVGAQQLPVPDLAAVPAGQLPTDGTVELAERHVRHADDGGGDRRRAPVGRSPGRRRTGPPGRRPARTRRRRAPGRARPPATAVPGTRGSPSPGPGPRRRAGRAEQLEAAGPSVATTTCVGTDRATPSDHDLAGPTCSTCARAGRCRARAVPRAARAAAASRGRGPPPRPRKKERNTSSVTRLEVVISGSKNVPARNGRKNDSMTSSENRRRSSSRWVGSWGAARARPRGPRVTCVRQASRRSPSATVSTGEAAAASPRTGSRSGSARRWKRPPRRTTTPGEKARRSSASRSNHRAAAG
jgi:hypothetical protein